MRKSVWLMSAGLMALAAPAHGQNNTPPAQPAPQQDATTAANGAVQKDSPNNGVADAAAPADAQVGGAIIITATRRASPLSDVPIAVSAVTAESLQNTGANDIRALNQLAPSLLVSSTGSEANGSARIRGIGTVGDNPGLESSVAVFIDGVYRSRTGVGLNELGEVERIEVLRGPQGTLFGRNASAGLINIVTKKPSFTLGGGGELTYGNYNYVRGAAGITGPLSDTIAFRIDGVYVRRDGFYKNITQGGGSESRVNDRNRYFVRGQLLFQPNDDFSFRLIGDYTHRRESCCGAVYVATKETTDPTPEAANTNPNGDVAYSASNRIVDVLQSLGGLATYPPANPYNRQVTVTPGRTFRNTTNDAGVSGELNYKLGGATLTSITAYRYYKSGGAGDVDYSNVDITYRADNGNAYRRFKTFTEELRLQGSTFGGHLDWLIGGYYANEKLQVVDNIKFGTQYGAFAACRIVATINPAAVLRNPAAAGCMSPTGRAALTGAFGAAAPLVLPAIDRLSTINDVGSVRDVYNQNSDNWAVFTHNIFNITDTLSLTLGARYTHEKKTLNAYFNNNNTVCPTQQAALGPLLANPALAAIAGGIITLSCTGNSSVQLNNVTLNDSHSEGQWTGTGVLSWKPTPRLLTYASYSKGYKAGGYNLDRSALGGATGVFGPRSSADAAGLRFEPEKVDAYELGFKYNRKGFSLNVAAFIEKFKTFQLNTFNGSIFIVQNIASCKASLNGADTDNSLATGSCTAGTKAGAESRGVEIEGAIYPMRDLAITAGYTYSHTRYARNLVASSGGAPLTPALFLLPGGQISNAPENVVTGSIAFTPPIGDSGLSALFYVDTRVTSKFNTGSDLFPEKTQPAFVLVNARFGIRGPQEKWAIELWAQNLLNEKYTQVAFNTPFQGAGSIAQTQAFGVVGNQLFSAFLAEPRTYGITGRIKF
ncbi:MAG TPA: TonB-dependent receptor [Allosphingosinicella sp.]|nr:TonB-dependent receptor [Allosphingosinicella sp.]